MMHIKDHLAVALLNGAPDALVCADASGRIIVVNDQAERLFGYRPGELAGKPVEALVPEAARDSHIRHRHRYMASPRHRPLGSGRTLDARRKDGTVFPADISLAAISSDDGPVILAAVRDATERLRREEEHEKLRLKAERSRLEPRLAQSQRLESLGQLAGGIAHDFNNLLAVISNYAAFVREEVSGPGSHDSRCDAIREDVEQIQRAAGRAADLTHQLLAFARRDVLKPQVLDLNESIGHLEPMLIRTLNEHVVLRTELAADLCPVFADPGQIEQVLVNLAVNARDAMPGGGTLLMQTRTVETGAAQSASLGGLPAGRYACLKVSDTGEGMTQDVIDHVFEPFFTTKPRGEGTGLGLSTVYGIIAQANGQIQVYSEPGLGTTFTIMLPAAGQDARPARAQEPDQGQLPDRVPAAGSGETVLVVEDEPAMLKVTVKILARNDYRVISAADPREAIRIAAEHAGGIDLLLTDVIMPHMLGMEVAEKICELRPGLKVLFMSGYTHGLLDTQGVLGDGIYLVEKPFTENSLLAKVRETLEADGPLGQAAARRAPSGP